ncbi:MAG: hypothetical protein Q4F61_00385 [Candidatus Saccharibacteria bacterium]|nr:hypothetical protein [Candidatus Saccharibacteria bacterium]
MKRNIFIVLTLALVCVLFVACGKEETPVDVAIGELQAARENIDNQIAVLEAQRPATKGGGTTVVHLAAAGQPTPTPVEKTRDQMTEKEKEAYDKAKIEELNAVELCDRAEAFYNTLDSGDLISAYYNTVDDLVVYCPMLEDLSEGELKRAAFPESIATGIFSLCDRMEDYCDFHEKLSDYLSSHPDELVAMAKLIHADQSAFAQRGDELLKKVVD